MKLSEALATGFAKEINGNIRLTKNLTELVVDIEVMGWLDCANNQLTSLIINHPIGGWLDCANNQLTSLEINHPIGGWLDCDNNQLTSLNINQPIGGGLDCRNNQLTSLNINHPIGGWLDCGINHLTSAPVYKRLQNGDSGNNWVYLDGQLFVYKHISTRKEYTIYTSVFVNSPMRYLVTDGTHSAHARTIKQAILDIRFKQMDRNMDDYRNLGLDDKLSYEDAVVMYRVITGACSGGTEDFLNSHPELSARKKYSIREIINLTSGQYGGEALVKFFAEGEQSR